MQSSHVASSKGKVVRRGLSRPVALKIAATLATLNSLSSLILFTPALARGANDLDQSMDTPPYFIILTGFTFSIIMIIAAYGTWKRQRWGIITMMVLAAVGAVLAAPGIVFAPTLSFWNSALVGVLLNIATVIFCLWRDPKATGVSQ